METEFAGSERLPESRDKLASKHAPQYLDREKEPIASVDPARVIGRQSTCGNDAMQMRMSPPASTVP